MSFSNLWSNFSKPSVIIPFVSNQLGSILNVYALSKVKLSVGNMLANSTSIAVTFLVQSLIDYKIPTLSIFKIFILDSLIGIILILLGVFISI